MEKKLSFFEFVAPTLFIVFAIVSLILVPQATMQENTITYFIIGCSATLILSTLLFGIILKRKHFTSYIALAVLGVFLFSFNINFVPIILGVICILSAITLLILSILKKEKIYMFSKIALILVCLVSFLALIQLHVTNAHVISYGILLAVFLFASFFLIDSKKIRVLITVPITCFLIFSCVNSIIQNKDHLSIHSLIYLIIYLITYLIPSVIALIDLFAVKKEKISNVLRIITGSLMFLLFAYGLLDSGLLYVGIGAAFLPLIIPTKNKKIRFIYYSLMVLGGLSLFILPVVLPRAGNISPAMTASFLLIIPFVCVNTEICQEKALSLAASTQETNLEDKDHFDESEPNKETPSFKLEHLLFFVIPTVLFGSFILRTSFFYSPIDSNFIMKISLLFAVFVFYGISCLIVANADRKKRKSISSLSVVSKFGRKYKNITAFLAILVYLIFIIDNRIQTLILYTNQQRPISPYFVIEFVSTYILALIALTFIVLQFKFEKKGYKISSLVLMILVLTTCLWGSTYYYILLILSLICLILAIYFQKKEILYSLLIFAPISIARYEFSILIPVLFVAIAIKENLPFFETFKYVKREHVERERVIETKPDKRGKTARLKSVYTFVPAFSLAKPYKTSERNPVNNFVFTMPVKRLVFAILKFMFLNSITLGIYSIFKLNDFIFEIQSYIRHPQGLSIQTYFTPKDFFIRCLINSLLLTVTFGIYSLFLPHKMIAWFVERTRIVGPNQKIYSFRCYGDMGGLILRMIFYPLLIIISCGFALPYIILETTNFILRNYMTPVGLDMSVKIGGELYIPEKEKFVETYLKVFIFTIFSFGFYIFQGSKKLTNEVLKLIEVSIPEETPEDQQL